jgi:hypothetical protein
MQRTDSTKNDAHCTPNSDELKYIKIQFKTASPTESQCNPVLKGHLL